MGPRMCQYPLATTTAFFTSILIRWTAAGNGVVPGVGRGVRGFARHPVVICRISAFSPQAASSVQTGFRKGVAPAAPYLPALRGLRRRNRLTNTGPKDSLAET